MKSACLLSTGRFLEGHRWQSDYGILDTCYRFEGNDEYFPFDMEEQNECDYAWDKLSEKFFALKKELAKEARKEITGKHVTAVIMHGNST
ncbi:hypothetical protein E6O75_ATG03572 [Venturia nashicola]|uniref:Uncharacterized protein n=1 Tax=Venturia nashicola TaxID=86259 RepID=A0A4Z1PE15_9PEZI|nr:hypothetical protein E6O75_ATG03572 [Venturia nashicola]